MGLPSRRNRCFPRSEPVLLARSEETKRTRHPACAHTDGCAAQNELLMATSFRFAAKREEESSAHLKSLPEMGKFWDGFRSSSNARAAGRGGGRPGAQHRLQRDQPRSQGKSPPASQRHKPAAAGKTTVGLPKLPSAHPRSKRRPKRPTSSA